MENDKIKYLTPEEVAAGKSGYVLAPYVTAEHTEDSLKDYNEFMAKYKNAHAVCPNCGNTSHTCTLMGFIMISDNREAYKDENFCHCTNCSDRHTVHQRISVEEFKNKKK